MTFTGFLAIFSLVASTAVAAYMWHWLRVQRLQAQESRQIMLSVTVRQDRLQSSTEKLQQEYAQLRQRLDDLEADSESLAQRMNKVEDYAGVCVPPKPAASGFNINRRVEAVRMFHDGFNEETIAEQLMIPLGEVRLLIHLEKNGKAGSGTEGAPKRAGRKTAAA